MKPRFYSEIEKANNIAIFSHINPDADALGSSFALKHLIDDNFDMKYVDVFVDGDVADLYKNLIKDEHFNPNPLDEYDLAIVLDCPNKQRTGKYSELLAEIPNIINIDHHETNKRFGVLNYVTPQVSSTSEMIYLLAQRCGLRLSDTIAKQLYQGIITDTNCFTSSYCTDLTHKVTGDLMSYNFDAEKIKGYYFENNSSAKTKLLANALLSMKFYDDNKLTTMTIDYKTFKKNNASFEDSLGIIDNGINITGTEVSAILIEQFPEHIHCSLRSKGNINVGEIANQFNGGGSTKLAAFQTDGTIASIERKLVQAIKPHLAQVSKEEEITF